MKRAIVDRVHRILSEYQWIHVLIGIVKLVFLAGSLLFLFEIKPLATYLFIGGSNGMPIRPVGSAGTKRAHAV